MEKGEQTQMAIFYYISPIIVSLTVFFVLLLFNFCNSLVGKYFIRNYVFILANYLHQGDAENCRDFPHLNFSKQSDYNYQCKLISVQIKFFWYYFRQK